MIAERCSSHFMATADGKVCNITLIIKQFYYFIFTLYLKQSVVDTVYQIYRNRTLPISVEVMTKTFWLILFSWTRCTCTLAGFEFSPYFVDFRISKGARLDVVGGLTLTSLTEWLIYTASPIMFRSGSTPTAAKAQYRWSGRVAGYASSGAAPCSSTAISWTTPLDCSAEPSSLICPVEWRSTTSP